MLGLDGVTDLIEKFFLFWGRFGRADWLIEIFAFKLIFTEARGADGDLSRRFDKLPEQIPRHHLICQPFGVPLHGETEGMVGQFYCLHQPIRRVTCNSKRGRDVFESLVVVAVDSHDRLAKHIGEARPFFDLYLMNQRMPHIAGIRMIERVWELVWQVRVQRPAEGDVHHLASAADAEEWLVIIHGGAGESQLDGVARRLHVGDARVIFAGEMAEGNVAATGEENPIQFGVQRVPAIVRDERGDQDRDAPRLMDRVGIRLLKHDARLPVFVI
jgi:hypothetical protein